MAIISEYVGLRAKCYANELYMLEEDKYICKKKAKGVPTRHTDKRLNFEDYKNCRENKAIITLGDKTATKEEHREIISSFRSLKLTTYSIEQSCNLSKVEVVSITIPSSLQKHKIFLSCSPKKPKFSGTAYLTDMVAIVEVL